MVHELDDVLQDGGDHLGRHQLAQGRERSDDDEDVGVVHVALQLVDEHEPELVLRAQHERRAQVAGALVDRGRGRSELDGTDVAERGVMAEHLGVHEADEELLHRLLVQVAVAHEHFQMRHLAVDDAVLLLLGLGLPDGLDQQEEVLGQVCADKTGQHRRHART